MVRIIYIFFWLFLITWVSNNRLCVLIIGVLLLFTSQSNVYFFSNNILLKGVGRTGWHIDGTFQPAPYAYSLYYMASVPKNGATVFAPLTEIIEGLSPEKYAEWDRLWMASDRRSGPVHPLIYTHPRSKKKVGWVILIKTDYNNFCVFIII